MFYFGFKLIITIFYDFGVLFICLYNSWYFKLNYICIFLKIKGADDYSMDFGKTMLKCLSDLYLKKDKGSVDDIYY